MALVLDASIALAWILPETIENKAFADRVFGDIAKPGGLALVPISFNLECAIALRRERNRGALLEADMERGLSMLEQLPMEMRDFGHSARAILRVSGAYGLHPSDALYVELALHSGVPLATLDEAMRAASRSLGVALA
jgi:predicted nucleic acid-binding protein